MPRCKQAQWDSPAPKDNAHLSPYYRTVMGKAWVKAMSDASECFDCGDPFSTLNLYYPEGRTTRERGEFADLVAGGAPLKTLFTEAQQCVMLCDKCLGLTEHNARQEEYGDLAPTIPFHPSSAR